MASGSRPQFGTGRATPEIQGRLLTMIGLLLVVAGLLAARLLWPDADSPATDSALVVEVQGDVPAPGFHSVLPPATVHGALEAAGASTVGIIDAELASGTRVVLADGGVRLEPMDDLLVVGLPVDVNRATAVALQAIPGLGPARAKAVVDERLARGPFSTVQDLERVRGIGPATVAKLRPFITAGPAALSGPESSPESSSAAR
jgi:competence ComEA-like helix-hairpin-helix protein